MPNRGSLNHCAPFPIKDLRPLLGVDEEGSPRVPEGPVRAGQRLFRPRPPRRLGGPSYSGVRSLSLTFRSLGQGWGHFVAGIVAAALGTLGQGSLGVERVRREAGQRTVLRSLARPRGSPAVEEPPAGTRRQGSRRQPGGGHRPGHMRRREPWEGHLRRVGGALLRQPQSPAGADDPRPGRDLLRVYVLPSGDGSPSEGSPRRPSNAGLSSWATPAGVPEGAISCRAPWRRSTKSSGR